MGRLELWSFVFLLTKCRKSKTFFNNQPPCRQPANQLAPLQEWRAQRGSNSRPTKTSFLRLFGQAVLNVHLPGTPAGRHVWLAVGVKRDTCRLPWASMTSPLLWLGVVAQFEKAKF